MGIYSENDEAQQTDGCEGSKINRRLINSRKYRKMFDRISANQKLNRHLFRLARRMLKHRSGTEYEDMYWLDADTAEIIAQETSGTKPQEIVYSPETKRKIENKTNLVTIHSHPHSYPPSPGDFNSNYKRGYQLGIICCHNGRVFIYRANGLFDGDDERFFGAYLMKQEKSGMCAFDAQMAALEKMKEYVDIEYREVRPDERK